VVFEFLFILYMSRIFWNQAIEFKWLISSIKDMNSDLKFIRRQENGVAHSLAKEAPSNPSFHIYSNIPSCIYDILVNEMQ